jgi:hypothetical protein
MSTAVSPKKRGLDLIRLSKKRDICVGPCYEGRGG